MNYRNSSPSDLQYVVKREKLYDFAMFLNEKKKQFLLRTSQLEDQLKINEEKLKCTNDKLQQSLEDKQYFMLKLKESKVSVNKLRKKNLGCQRKLKNLSSKLKKTENKLKLAVGQYTARQQTEDLLNNCQLSLAAATNENDIYKERIALLTSELNNETIITQDSAVYVKKVISYLLYHNPGVEDSIWHACVNFCQKSGNLACPEMEPIGIINSMIEALELTSTEECFSKKEEYNYSLALTLLCTRFDQSWIIKNIMKQKLFAVIERFLVSNNTKMCGVVVLCCKFMRDLATDDNTQIICLEFIKKVLTSIKENTAEAPVHVIMASYHCYYVLHKKHHKTVDQNSSRWLQRHGFNFEKMRFEK